jgi:extracellular elastinolytic metalloproteinase
VDCAGKSSLRGVLFALLVVLAVGLLPSSALGVAQIHASTAKPDLDTNRALVAPTAAQQQAVTRLGATASWNRFGTPSSLLKTNGYLATGLGGDAVAAARSFLDSNKALYKLSSANDLVLVNDVTLKGTNAHAVLFAERYGDLVADWEGLIAVGVVDGKIAYVSSSASGAEPVTGSVKLSATDAWAIAARNVGVPVNAVSGLAVKDGWTYFDVAGLTKSIDQVAVRQGAKLVAFPTEKNGVRPAWLVNVIDLRDPASPAAYQTMVDADNGAVLFRHDAVQQDAQGSVSTRSANDSAQQLYSFTGTYTPPDCGPAHAFAVGAGQKGISVIATEANASNDIILSLIDPNGNVVSNSDVATSPEAVVYQDPAGNDLATGNWVAQVCPYNGPSLQPPLPNQTAPFDYVVAVTVAPAGASLPTLPRIKPPTLVTNNPRWAFFPSFPSTDYSTTAQSEGCWSSTDDGFAQPKACEVTFDNPASPFGWDIIPRTNQATLTTRGNNAFTAESWLSPLSPSENRSPVSPDRYYDRNFPGGNFIWTNSWYTNKCDPSALTDPTKNNADIDAATTNLFVMHNRMHDFAYALGFTESTYNAQLDNLDHGNQSSGPYPLGREDDPELGDAQAGALDGGTPSEEGRDNANQITLNDGTPPITNQYLWQPLASAFYSPCTDGSFDLSVAGHEYTHLISNRMVGGPDASLSSAQGGAMGESWSDLDALEFLHESGLAGKQGEDPWSLGAYVTGNKSKGIRDYALDRNPLNYSDVGFDTTGPEVHADGEIWNGVNYEVRQALVDSVGDTGGRRWIQLVYDAWLLEQGDLSMVDAAQAMIGADKLRYGGADVTTLANAFAHRGLGQGATSATGDDDQPTPSFASAAATNGNVSFVTVAKDGPNAGAPVPADVFVGDYQARVTPIVDTDPSTALGNSSAFVPGTYSFVVQSPGYGLVKFTRTIAAGDSTLTIALPTNWASSASGATASGDGVNLGKLIDDDENTNWASLSGAVAGKAVTVTLDGRHTLSSVRVSALNHPSTCDGATEEQGTCVAGSGNDPDNTAQNRFSALRAFTIQTCDSSVKNCSNASNWVTAFDSPANAFPAARPRPVAPDVNLRSWDLAGNAATMVRIVVKTNQCTGGPDFQGDQDNDPTNNSDCASSSNATKVRAAELEVVSSDPTITQTAGTSSVVSTAPASASTAAPASTIAPSSAAKPIVVVNGVRAASKVIARISAHGAIKSAKGREAVFGLLTTTADRGSLSYTDVARALRLRSARVSTVLIDYRNRTATVTGDALDGKRKVGFTLELTDRAHADAFRIALTNGYRLGGKLVRGQISIA